MDRIPMKGVFALSSIKRLGENVFVYNIKHTGNERRL